MQNIKHQPLTTRVKARNINEDKNIYGTFAEIGAGQEVASAFFKVGGASRTIAKTMSAYDMTFSDTIYGKEKSGRYVVENRLHKMLEREFSLLEKRIGEKMADRRFFVFADTIATKSPKNGRPGHGWLGCMFQLEPQGPVHKIILHVHLYESLIASQQNLIGVLGVNLLYAAFRYSADAPTLIQSLKDGLEGRKFHIDVIKVEGESFSQLDSRSLNLLLLSNGLANAILFDEKGKIQSVSDMFYNQTLLVARGRFRPPTLLTQDLLKQGSKQLKASDKDKVVLPICELTYNHLISKEQVNEADLILRLEFVSSLKMPTLITNFEYHYRLSEYLSTFTQTQVAFALGVANLVELFKEDHYRKLPGGILEAMGRLFKEDVRILLYPKKDENGNIIRGANLEFSKHLGHLFQHLWSQGLICDYDKISEPVLDIYSEEVLQKIRTGQPWEEFVPKPVAAKITEHIALIKCELEKEIKPK